MCVCAKKKKKRPINQSSFYFYFRFFFNPQTATTDFWWHTRRRNLCKGPSVEVLITGDQSPLCTGRRTSKEQILFQTVAVCVSPLFGPTHTMRIAPTAHLDNECAVPQYVAYCVYVLAVNSIKHFFLFFLRPPWAPLPPPLVGRSRSAAQS